MSRAIVSYGMMLGLVMLVLLGFSSMFLMQQVETITIGHQAELVNVEWLKPDQVQVPSNLVVSIHSAKHHGDTNKIYDLLLEGKCAEVAKFCGGSPSEFAYFCVDPVTGIIGAILQIGTEITTGFYEKSGSNYWIKRIPREKWVGCE